MARFDLQDFKKQASFFLREKLNDARLALTDVSRMQLLTEEATNEDPWGPETRTMAMLADAAFELEEYERIVQVIHHRLNGGKKRPWRQLYKTLVVLEYLLTHGPKSMGREFRTDVCWVDELSQFNLTDQQGIDRGLMVRKKADRVLELINNADFRNEERCRVRKISVGIQGFGSSPHQVHPEDGVVYREQRRYSTDTEGISCSSDELIEDIASSKYQLTELTEQSRSAGARMSQVEPKGAQYERCCSVSSQCKQGGSSLSVSEKNLSEERFSTKSYKKSLSSPSYFRERMVRWEPAQNSIMELEEVNVGLLDTVEENDCSSCKDLEGRLISEAITEASSGLSMAPCEGSLSLFEGVEASPLVYTCSSASSFFPALSQLAIPKHRMKFQHQWQPPRLADCNVKFGKAA